MRSPRSQVIFEEFNAAAAIDRLAHGAADDMAGRAVTAEAVLAAPAKALPPPAPRLGAAKPEHRPDTPLLAPDAMRSDDAAAGTGGRVRRHSRERRDERPSRPSSPSALSPGGGRRSPSRAEESGPSALLLAACESAPMALQIIGEREEQNRTTWCHVEAARACCGGVDACAACVYDCVRCRCVRLVDWSSCTLHGLATSSTLGSCSTALVLLNMLTMALPFEGMPAAYEANLELSYTLITTLFALEMALKLGGLGWRGYWSDGWNALDGAIVIESLVDLLLTDLLIVFGEGNDVPRLSWLRILRLLRIVRVLRLMRSWTGLYKIIVTFGKAISQISNLFVLMSLVMVIFSLVGMQAYARPSNSD